MDISSAPSLVVAGRVITAYTVFRWQALFACFFKTTVASLQFENPFETYYVYTGDIN